MCCPPAHPALPPDKSVTLAGEHSGETPLALSPPAQCNFRTVALFLRSSEKYTRSPPHPTHNPDSLCVCVCVCVCGVQYNYFTVWPKLNKHYVQSEPRLRLNEPRVCRVEPSDTFSRTLDGDRGQDRRRGGLASPAEVGGGFFTLFFFFFGTSRWSLGDGRDGDGTLPVVVHDVVHVLVVQIHWGGKRSKVSEGATPQDQESNRSRDTVHLFDPHQEISLFKANVPCFFMLR